jgi:hypothetical protein
MKKNDCICARQKQPRARLDGLKVTYQPGNQQQSGARVLFFLFFESGVLSVILTKTGIGYHFK